MTLEEALLRIEELETIETANKTAIAGLADEKTALLRKRDELLGKLSKLKKFEAYADLDVEELIRIKEAHETSDGETKSRYEEAYKTDKVKFETRLAQMEKEREQEKTDRETEKAALAAAKLRSAAIVEFSKPEHGVFSAEQLFRLIGDTVRINDRGDLVVGDEYKEVSIADHLKALREDTAYQNQFKGTGATGSGSLPGQGSTGSATVNPWKAATFNLTEQARITRANPAQAATLKAQAGA
jgi:hypothetical protein